MKKKKRLPFKTWIIIGVLVSALTMMASLAVYMGPSVLQKTAATVRSISMSIYSAAQSRAAAKEKMRESEEAKSEPQTPDAQPSIPYLAPSEELGRLDDLGMENGSEGGDATYSVMLNTAMGPMLYYNQGDSRWADYLYGGQDPMKKYGCGPTAVAMIINSFSSTTATPVSAADWASANGCYALHGGSYHNLIHDALSAHGIHVESVKSRTADNAASLLDSGHILIALMGKGALTDNGHFILITEHLDNGNVRIADPNSYENSTKEWALDQLISELKHSYDSGAPLWAVRHPGEEEG